MDDLRQLPSAELDVVLPEVAVLPEVTDGDDAALLALIDRLAELLHRSDLSELEVESGGTALLLRKPEAARTAAAEMADPPRPATAGTTDASRATVAEADLAAVRAPLTGIFYSAPSPGSAPYLRVGGEVAVGQVIGLIEAMKLFNEIKSDRAGRVVRIVAENGQLVKAKQPLIEVEPL
jgi:acetyl-CoA carboxylase biotin carboxyl carrier protein